MDTFFKLLNRTVDEFKRCYFMNQSFLPHHVMQPVCPKPKGMGVDPVLLLWEKEVENLWLVRWVLGELTFIRFLHGWVMLTPHYSHPQDYSLQTLICKPIHRAILLSKDTPVQAVTEADLWKNCTLMCILSFPSISVKTTKLCFCYT